jgi:hypothetical protein
MRSGRILGCGVLAAMALLTGGCGDDNNDSTTQAAVTRAEYVQSVKARCGDYQRERHAAEKPLAQLFQSANTASQIAPAQLKAASDQLAALNDTTRQVLIDLSSLPRPEADQAALDQVFASYDDAHAALDDADQAAADGDGAGVDAAFKKLDAALNSGSKQVKDEFGFSACG